MHRSFAWGMIAILAIMLAPFAGVLGVPTSTAHADTAAPTAAADDEIIVITSAGVVRVDDPTTPTGPQPSIWTSASESGWETSWTAVAAGDFNGDGDAELVAARNTASGSFVKVFDPVVQPGRTKVNYSVNLGSGNSVRLLVTGDFDGDHKDEFAVLHYISGGARLVWYDGGANAIQGDWTQRNSATYVAMFQDMSTGDFNNDRADDLALVRNKVLTTTNMQTLSTMAERTDSPLSWYAVAGGNLDNSTSTPGDEIAASRDFFDKYQTVVPYKYVSSKLEVLKDNTAWSYNPPMTSISSGDLNGDGDDEVVVLRDPLVAKTSLLMVNPAGATMSYSFEQATGYGSAAFRIVRTGDTDGDGKDEIVILKGDRYRIYTDPDVGGQATETTGSFYAPSNSTTGNVSNLPYMTLANVDTGVASGPALGVTPASLSFSLDCGNASPLKPLSIINAGTGSDFAWQAQAIETNGSGWLHLDTTSGTTPGTVNVSVSPGVAKGNYTGKIEVTTTNPDVQIKTVDVPVSYEQLCSGFVVSPTTLDFSDVPWGSTGSKPIAISAPGSTGWSAEVVKGSTWLTLSAPAGTTPSTLYVIVNPAAAGIGVSQGTIELTAANPALPNYRQSVYVNLTVEDPGFVVTPTDITIWQAIVDYPTTVKRYMEIERPLKQTDWSFSAQELSQAVGLEEKLANGQATVTADGLVIDGVLAASPSWLVLTPLDPTTPLTTPATMSVSVVPGTPAGDYRAVITVVANGDPTLTNPVQLVYVTAHVVPDVHLTLLPFIKK
jgi:hypothetical protein